MKKLALTLFTGLLTLTACDTTEADSSGYESIEEVMDAIDKQTNIECSRIPLEDNIPDDTDETWDTIRCEEGGIAHYLQSDGAKDYILDYLAESDATTKTQVALGEEWIFIGDHQQAKMVRDGLNGKQPNLAARAPAVTPTSTPTGPAFKITCDDEDGNDTGEFSSPEAAWDELSANERANCRGAWVHRDQVEAAERHAYSDTESEAIEVADYEQRSLPTLYALCAESHLGDHDESKPWSSGQLQELEGALILCPDHPEREIVEERTADATQAEAEREQGIRFGNGTYRVGEDIQPGTYVVEVEEPFDGCYWQRLDASGNTIDNNFISSGFRAEVTIAASDHSFSSERCGEWVKQ